MVNRELRDFLADAIHELIAGYLVTDHFMDRIWRRGLGPFEDPNQWEDGIIGPIVAAGWGLFDDIYPYRLRGWNKPSRKTRADVLRWVLFLRSNAEYRWPPFRFHPPPTWSGCLFTLLTLDIGPQITFRRRFAEWSKNGDFAFWPFLDRTQYDNVYGRHCVLALLAQDRC